MPRPVVIVGASAAGLSVAEGLRGGGYAGRLVIIGAEREVPCDRPPLSKHILAGTREPADLALLPGARLADLEADWVLGRRAVALDTASRVVVTDDGRAYPYAAAVLATGVRPRTLPGHEASGSLVLRTTADALALRRRLVPGARLVVIGAGFLGLEVAATARRLGAQVTVVEPSPAPLATRLGSRAASGLIDLHRSNGVRILLGVQVADISAAPPAAAPPAATPPPVAPQDSSAAELPDPGHTVRLSNRTRLQADTVLVAIGCAPSTAWLESSGLALDDGVLCDEYGQAGAGQAIGGVWAAGDVARWRQPATGRHLRVEHRVNATEQGSAVARNILGARLPLTAVPFFWTDQYAVKVQVAGHVPADGRSVTQYQNPDTGAFIEGFFDGDRLVGAVAWNAPRQLLDCRRQLAAQLR